MKCSSLLKPNKISYTHQNNKQNPEPKAKMSSRHSTPVNERSSMADLMIIANPSKKNIIVMNAHSSNKQNQTKNIDHNKQPKKDPSSSKPNQNHNSNPQNKQFDMYLSDKMPKPNKLSRNMSMHISSSDIMEEVPAHNPRLNNSSMSNYTKQILPPNTKKRKLSKPLMENSSLLNVNHHRHSSVILSRSPLSDKNVLIKDFKEKKEEKATHVSKNHEKQYENKNHQKQLDRNYDSCKSVQSSRTIQQSKSLSIIGEKKTPNVQILHTNNSKPSMGLIKKSKSPNQTHNDEYNHKTLAPKTQSKSKSILVLKQNKGHETSRKIKRTKLSWLFVINQVYVEVTKNQKSISLYRLVQELKGYEKKHHPLEQFISCEISFSDNEQQTTLTQLLLFVKMTLLHNPQIVFSPVIFKPHSNNQIDSQKTYLTFTNMGQILFSQQSIIQYLHQSSQSSTNIPSHPQHKLPQKNIVNQSPSSLSHIKNSHNMSTKQDQEIVQTARFQQNHHSHHHSRQSSDGMSQKVKKKTIFMDPNHQEIYSQGIDLISAKLQKSSHNTNPNYHNSNYPHNPNPNYKRPFQHPIPYPSPVDKSFISRKSSSTSSNHQPKSNGTTNKQISHCSIQDISQILINQHQKPLVTSFNKKFYPSSIINHSGSYPNPFPEDSFVDNSNNEYSWKNSNGMQEICMSKGMESGQLQSCRIQALNMNSSLLFLESVILNNLYHTNFNVSFSEQPIIDNDDYNDQSLMRSIKQRDTSKQNSFNRLQDVIQEVQNILKSMKNLFSLDCQSRGHNDKQFLNKHITKQSIKIQDLTQMQQFLFQFIDYKVFRKQSKSSSSSSLLQSSSQLSQKSSYFNAVKLTQNNLTSFHTKKAAQNVIKSPLISKYFSFIEGIRITQGPFLIQNIDKLLLSNHDKISKIRILNLSNNELTSIEGLMNVIEANIKWLGFLNLSNNKIESIEGLFKVLERNYNGRQEESNYDERVYCELRELHLKNNRIQVINYKVQSSPLNNKNGNKQTKYSQSQKLPHFPHLQLLDLRSNLLSSHQKPSIQQIIHQSPLLSIMSLKQNPILSQKSQQKSQLQKLLNYRSIYQYDSLQMMSAYIKYKDITFSDSGQNCCSLVENGQADNGQVEIVSGEGCKKTRNGDKRNQNMGFGQGVVVNNRRISKVQKQKQVQKNKDQVNKRRKISSIKIPQLEDNSF